MLEADENQYSAGGVSACTVMSTEAALQVLQLSAEGTVDEAGLLLALNAALRPAALYSVAPTAVECSCMHRVPPSEIVRFEVSGLQTAGRVRKLEPGPDCRWSERERERDR